MASLPPTAISVAHIGLQPTILIIGASGLDRLLTVDQFPAPDSKIRTTRYDEVGGGNAANTATAMARLAKAKCFETPSRNNGSSHYSLRVKLISKLGDDAIATTLLANLRAVGVDTSCVIQDLNTTTSLTTVIVDSSAHTRTCLHSPGTCGELTAKEMQDMIRMNNELLLGEGSVIHVHCDGRHTEAAHVLAVHAQERHIPVSVDIEKDRHSKAMNWLLKNSTLVFTNSNQMHDYLQRLEDEWFEQQPHKSTWLPSPTISSAVNLSPEKLEVYLKALEPSAFMTRWFAMNGKEVVITKGDRGAFHVRCHHVAIEDGPECISPTNDVMIVYHKDEGYVDVLQDTADTNCCNQHKQTTRMHCANYFIRNTGILKDASVVDTTGAGDAFIAGYLLSHLTCRSTLDTIPTSLRLGAWVSGRKLAGPGAQSALPTASDLEKCLGSTIEEVEESLKRDIGQFRFDDVT